MVENRLPLRAATWAMTGALGLVLLLTLSDPYAVRQSILATDARSVRPQPSSVNDMLLATRDASLIDHDDLNMPAHLSPSEETVTGATIAAGQVVSDNAENQVPVPLDAALLSDVATHTVSIPLHDERTEAGRQVSKLRAAMPVLAPGSLAGNCRGGEFVELPPPPGMEYDEALLATESPLQGSVERSVSTDTAITERLKTLQSRQTQILEHQQEAASRLSRMEVQLTGQSEQIERLLDRLGEVSRATLLLRTAEEVGDGSDAAPRSASVDPPVRQQSYSEPNGFSSSTDDRPVTGPYLAPW